MVLNVKTKSKQICDEIAFPFFQKNVTSHAKKYTMAIGLHS